MAAKIPFPFVLEWLEKLRPYTKPMFGAFGVYAGDRILFILRQKETQTVDNGLWVATYPEHHASLRAEMPSLRDLVMFGPGPTAWQNLAVDAPTFDVDVQTACELVLKGDPRIGKVPKVRRKLAVKTKLAKTKPAKTRRKKKA